MHVTSQSVECVNRKTIPLDNESILDDIELDVDKIKTTNIYFRSPQDCPFARGNWLIDIAFVDGSMLCVKLPKDMKEEKVLKYFKPLYDELKRVNSPTEKVNYDN